MRAALTLGWLLVPIALYAVHLGPGRLWLARDSAVSLARAADRASAHDDWESAADKYTAALAALPDGTSGERRRLEVAQGRALVMSGAIVEGQERLEKTLEEWQAAEPQDTELALAARAELAAAGYYAAWIMRLEGATAAEWKPESERARQQYRWLTERSLERAARQVSTVALHGEANGERAADVFQRNLEAAIRLEQMDLTELMARPLPKNCPKCKQALCQRKRKQCASRCHAAGEEKQPGQKKEEQDARKDVKENNGAGLYSGERIGS